MHYELLELLKKNDYVSGTRIGEVLGISRSAVWKNIEALRREGCVIEAVTNRGYRLITSGEYNAAAICEKLETDFIGRSIRFYKDIPSTNDKLKTLAATGEKDGTAVVAVTQSAGRGRRGRIWLSAEDKGVYFSLLVRPEIGLADASAITLVAGLSVCRALNDAFGVKALIKWPNDVTCGGKKICGILSEMGAEGYDISYIVIGIGINTDESHFDGELKDIATSVYMETGAKPDKAAVLAEVLNRFEKYYNIYIKDGFEALKAEYKALSTVIGKRVHVLGVNGFDGVAEDVLNDGALVVRDTDGRLRNVYSGEVSLRLWEAEK